MTCTTEAKVVAHSVGRDAPPIKTLQLRYPLQIHAELMTHRVFSRNARSSRAVPTARLIQEVRDAPFIPRYWTANEKGMQGKAGHEAPVRFPVLMSSGRTVMVDHDNEHGWLWARDRAVEAAEAFAAAGYHKQICNRILAPFLHIDVVLTTTDLENWNALRDDAAAEPHIRDLAIAMKEALAASTPTRLEPGEWHLPYIRPEDWEAIWALGKTGEKAIEIARAMSVVRCAQVSYEPFHEDRLTIEQEVFRHHQLITARPMHASPLEHQATPDTLVPRSGTIWCEPEMHGNLRGWVQYRKTIEGEAVYG